MGVRLEGDPEQIIRLRNLRRERDELRARAVAIQDPTPGHLARRLDPATVQTPALEIIDRELVEIRDAVDTMYRRRARLVELLTAGVDDRRAVEQAADEIESRGNDRLILSMPPQEGKTTRVSRYGLLWIMRQYPMLRGTIVSYDGDKASEPSRAIRGDIELFDGSNGNADLGLRLVKDQKAMSRWSLVTGGGLYAIGIGGGLTGRPSDLMDIDDPIKDLRAAESILLSEQQWEWWTTVARPRLAPWAPVILTLTRWDELDLAGRLRAKQEEDEASGLKNFDRWRVVTVPAEADHDPTKGELDILGREPGEFMVSARGRTRELWQATKAATPPRHWSAIYQGKPTPGTGEVWLREWWRRFEEIPWRQELDGSFRVDGWDLTQSWDMAFKDTKATDYVVGQVWAKRYAESKLIYVRRARLNFTATIDAVLDVRRLFPQTRRTLVEEKANGAAVIDSLRKTVPGMIAVNPTESKTARAEAVSPFIRAGNVQIPTPAIATLNPSIAWDVEAFIEEATSFPRGQHDDQVDAASQYLREVYLDAGGPFVLSSPTGETPRPSMRAPARGANLGAQQRRLTERALGGKR